jgi:hypothetical protein
LAVFFVCVLLISIPVGVCYGILSGIRQKIFGKSPGRYVEEANLKKGEVSWFQSFLVLNRSPMVLAVVLPISRAWQIYGTLRTSCMQALSSAPNLHAERVAMVQKQFKQWADEGGKRRIVTARPGWQRVSIKNSTYKKDCFQLRVDRLGDILKIDTDERYVRVEPMVTMGQLVPVLMQMGWTLPVVPELEELTVGGMIAGTGVESSSHHSGLFQEFCLELEVALASGEIVNCSKTERPDLYEGFFWSYGTLGMLMSAKLRIIPCAPYIRLEYYGFESEKSFTDFFREESEKGLEFIGCDSGPEEVNQSEGQAMLPGRKSKTTKDNGKNGKRNAENLNGNRHGGGNATLPQSKGTTKERSKCARFVEGLIFAQHRGVVMRGDFAHEVGKDGQLYQHGKWYKPYFYKHADEMLSRSVDKGGPVVEYWPIRDYYYRHSRSVFWEMENIVPLGDSLLFRWAFGWLLPPSVSFLKLTTPKGLETFYDTKHVIQDMLVPVSVIEKSLAIFRKHFDMYPLWVCPHYLRPGRGLVHAQGQKPVMYVDLGAYGVPGAVKKAEDYDVVKEIRAVEDYVASVKGFEMLYADSYMTRTEFGRMFDRTLYEDLRKSFGGDKAFPDIYDKIVEPKKLQVLKQRFGEEKCK